MDNQDRADILQRILWAVEESRRQKFLDLILAILLAVTALASTWCAYQSQLWNGVQLVRLTEAEISSQLANQKTLAAMQHKTMDALVLLQYMEARERDHSQWAEVIHRRMPSHLREAVDAWSALDPLNNPSAPPPGEMAEYDFAEKREAEQARKDAHHLRTAAHQAGNHGDAYVLLTLLFALVLFFGGIACTIQSPRLRWGLTILAFTIFTMTTLRLTWMPICPG
jgi:hypothetical protein